MLLGIEVNSKSDIVGGSASICVKNPDPKKYEKKCLRLLFRIKPVFPVIAKIIELLDKGDATVHLDVKAKITAKNKEDAYYLQTYLEYMGIKSDVEINENKDNIELNLQISAIISSAGKTKSTELKFEIDTICKDKEQAIFEIKRMGDVEKIVWRRKEFVPKSSIDDKEIKKINDKEVVAIEKKRYNKMEFVENLNKISEELTEYEERGTSNLLGKALIEKISLFNIKGNKEKDADNILQEVIKNLKEKEMRKQKHKK